MTFHKKHSIKLSSEAIKFVSIINHSLVNSSTKEVMKQLYSAVDKVMTSRYNKHISCTGTCSFCCHDEIIMSTFEAYYLKDKIKNIKPNKVYLNKQLSNGYNNLNWEQRKCSLLKDGQCSIYKDRPLICRTHNSMDDPIYCNQEDFPTKGHQQVFTIEVEAIMLALVIISKEHIMSLHNLLKD